MDNIQQTFVQYVPLTTLSVFKVPSKVYQKDISKGTLNMILNLFEFDIDVSIDDFVKIKPPIKDGFDEKKEIKFIFFFPLQILL